MRLVEVISRRKHMLRIWAASALLLCLSLSGCFFNTEVEPFYGRVTVPRTQEFNWSDGGLPQTFDPAFAAAPPDTDLVRAIFEGLTDYDSKTLTPIPAVATRWEPSNGGRVWTFYLREDARWSNGEAVTAADFVRSWQRTMRIGYLAPHTQLLANIDGAEKLKSTSSTGPEEGKSTEGDESRRVGVEAVSDSILRVRLRRPDMNFPALVAHPVFRPVKVGDNNSLSKLASANLISNGAFSLTTTNSERVLLQRADNYWGRDQVALQRVAFVGAKDSESALAAYRAGELDAVTNAAFEPLAIKLLTPYEDFRRSTYGALTYYSFNTAHQPFDDVRVREALALAIDRDRISEDDLGGSTEPAKRFLPETTSAAGKPVVDKSELLEKDHDRARQLLAEAGFPDGERFPRVRLLINRNEQQRLVAQSVAGMWKTVLNIDSEILIRNWDEYEPMIRAGDFDVVRRGVVMQTTDELTNIRMLFGEAFQRNGNSADQSAGSPPNSAPGLKPSSPSLQSIETEEQALNNLSSMPIYFASSYALVKPYVQGFESNVLDLPSLKTVRIDTSWRPPNSER